MSLVVLWLILLLFAYFLEVFVVHKEWIFLRLDNRVLVSRKASLTFLLWSEVSSFFFRCVHREVIVNRRLLLLVLPRLRSIYRMSINIVRITCSILLHLLSSSQHVLVENWVISFSICFYIRLSCDRFDCNSTIWTHFASVAWTFILHRCLQEPSVAVLIFLLFLMWLFVNLIIDLFTKYVRR